MGIAQQTLGIDLLSGGMEENDHLTTTEHDVPPSMPRRKRVVGLAVAALVLCTAGGAIGGLALGEALHTGDRSTSAAPGGMPFGGGYGHVYGSPPQGYGLPGSGPQQSGTVESTATPTSQQLVGLVRIQSTLGYAGGAAVGTGMVMSTTGEVITNHHVIAGATRIIATVMTTGQQYQARVVGSDTSDDIAVLQLTGATGLATVHTSTAAPRVGESVTAVGDAEGATTFTASAGTITALNQSIAPTDGVQRETLRGVIQYAAAVMSGDSGGATYDTGGAVIGMTTAASTGGTQTNGYAIPIATVLRVAHDLSNHATGASYTYGSPAFIGVGVSQAAIVEQVYAGTGAASSGLTPGDRIVAVDGTAIANAADLQQAVRVHRPGESVTVTWITSAGTRQTATIRLIAGPAA